MRRTPYNRPQKRRNRRRAIAVTLLIVSSIILISNRQQKTMLASGRLSVDDVSSKIMGVISVPVRGVEALFFNIKDRKNVFQDNKKLKKELERLRPYESQVLMLQKRVGRFEEIFAIEASSDIPKQKIVTRSVSESNGPFAHSALINAGKNKDVKTGYAVMSIDGLYGHVVRTGRVSARVLLLNDLNSRISVMSQRSQSRAILVGNNTNQPSLQYISPESDWKLGDRVVTSGDGGVLPRGLNVGTVVIGSRQNNEVDLLTQKNPIDWVWVLPFMPIPTPENLPALPDVDAPTKPAEKSGAEHE